jgi:hypothetical protein
MTLKLIAIGGKKYVADKMNWLDGSVVSLSIIELIMNAIGGTGHNLSAFRTIRVLRTFRVLRVIRLLRTLKSLKLIINVVTNSGLSIFYVTLLLFIFLFIYTILGSQLFGGNLIGKDGVTPRANFDSFLIGFYTTF